MAGVPPAGSVLKPLAKYLQQARQVEKVDPLISYYCRLYALQSGMKISGKSKDDLKLIAEQMTWLEANQRIIAGVSKEEGRQRAETFALQVFTHGDNEDRAGLATKKTALNFHAAYVLMDVCRQFSPTGDLASDVEEKQRYAIVKAADINKAIKEGRKPKAGPLNEPSEEEQAEDDALLATLGAAPSTAPPAAAAASSTGMHFGTAASPFGASASSSYPYSDQSSLPSSRPLFHSTSSPPPVAPHEVESSSSSSSSSASAFPFLNSDVAPLPPTYNPHSYLGTAPDATGYSPQQTSAPAVASGAASPFSSASASAPPPAAAPTPSVRPSTVSFSRPTPPAAASSPAAPSPFSAAATAARNSGTTSSFARRDTKQLDAVRDSERLIKHALSAVVFSDIDTTVSKLKEALAMLQPYSNK